MSSANPVAGKTASPDAIRHTAIALLWLLAALCPGRGAAAPSAAAVVIPEAAAAPRINGPAVFGVRPQSPFLYTIPATGERPRRFAVDNLPAGLTLDPASGRITGTLDAPGEYAVVLRVQNAVGAAERRFRIICGERICLTPPMGWNSWNCWGLAVDQDKILRAAKAMAASGLGDHGWSYVNIDGGWQGRRSGSDHALEGNEKFPDLPGLCAAIHRLGLKVGVYSTPWITGYGRCPGGSSDRSDGGWSPDLAGDEHRRFGRFSFAAADAARWAAWGVDYLKYDWAPTDLPHVIEMAQALRASGRDIVFSVSNFVPREQTAEFARWANCWRTTGDICDRWDRSDPAWAYAVSEIGFSQDAWEPFAGPGHWNDPDMLVVGQVGWGPELHPTRLTPDEQYSHFSLWCLLSAPLLLGCDLERLDEFTLSLLTNDEVLALDQDTLGRQARRVAAWGAVDIFLKELEGGDRALGFFNRDSQAQQVDFNKLDRIGLEGAWRVRDLWRRENLPAIEDAAKASLRVELNSHGVRLYRLTPAR